MTGNVAQVGPAEQLLHPLARGAVARPMKAVASYAELLAPAPRHGVRGGSVIHRVEEGGFEQHYERKVRKGFPERADCGNVRGVVSRRVKGELLHGLQHGVIHPMCAAQRTGMDRLETDCAQARWVGDFRQAAPDGRVVAGADSLHLACCRGLFAWHVEDAVLEGGAADVGHQNLHGLV